MPKKTAKIIVEQGGHYLLQLKKNQPHLYRRAQRWSQASEAKGPLFVNKGHGRLEQRRVQLYDFSADFPHLKTLIVCERQRHLSAQNKDQQEKVYYLSDLAKEELDEQPVDELIRGHWGGVENRNHWRRDAL